MSMCVERVHDFCKEIKIVWESTACEPASTKHLGVLLEFWGTS